MEEHDSDSIHSFDLNELSQSVSSSLAICFSEKQTSFYSENEYFDDEVERFLTPWGHDEVQNFLKDIKCVTKQDNGGYLSDEEIASWRKKHDRGFFDIKAPEEAKVSC